MHERTQQDSPRRSAGRPRGTWAGALVALLLALGASGCAVNPVPTPGDEANGGGGFNGGGGPPGAGADAGLSADAGGGGGGGAADWLDHGGADGPDSSGGASDAMAPEADAGGAEDSVAPPQDATMTAGDGESGDAEGSDANDPEEPDGSDAHDGTKPAMGSDDGFEGD